MGYSKNQKLAKDFLVAARKEQFRAVVRRQKGFSVGSTTDWEKHKMWEIDPVMLRPYRTAARAFRLYGYAGRRRAASSRVEVHITTSTPRRSRA